MTGDDVRAVATRLFAELGYDGVSLQMIADAANVDRSLVTEKYGGKSELYKASIEQLTQQWDMQFDLISKHFTPDADGLYTLFDRYLMHCLENPELAMLWHHRWMADAKDILDIEEHCFGPALTKLLALTHRAVRTDIDAEIALVTLAWTINTYVQGGLPTPDGKRQPPDDPAAVHRMRAYLRWITREMAERN